MGNNIQEELLTQFALLLPQRKDRLQTIFNIGVLDILVITQEVDC